MQVQLSISLSEDLHKRIKSYSLFVKTALNKLLSYFSKVLSIAGYYFGETV